MIPGDISAILETLSAPILKLGASPANPIPAEALGRMDCPGGSSLLTQQAGGYVLGPKRKTVSKPEAVANQIRKDLDDILAGAKAKQIPPR
jgi:hypothetical protein